MAKAAKPAAQQSSAQLEQKMDENDDLHPDHLPPAPDWPLHPAMVTTTFELPGYHIVQNFGVVRGLVVRSPGIGGAFSASLQAMGGGNVEALRALCETARHDAFVMMLEDATRFRANGVIGFRYDTTEIGQNLTEVLAYGSAVLVELAK